MVRRHRAKATDSSQEINLTPMLDVVFILLIFFIVTSQFIKNPGVSVNRPDADNRAQARPRAILVVINAKDEVFIDRQEVPMVEVRFALGELLLQNPQSEIVVQADVNSSAGTMVDVMQAIHKVDGSTVINISAKSN